LENEDDNVVGDEPAGEEYGDFNLGLDESLDDQEGDERLQEEDALNKILFDRPEDKLSYEQKTQVNASFFFCFCFFFLFFFFSSH
jgi:hypothetical protein